MMKEILLSSGNIIDKRYKILNHLGSNAYKIYDLYIGRVLVIKIHKKNEDEISQRFLREVKIMAHTNHSYILPVYEFGEFEEYVYYTMPFQKYTLRRFILEFPDEAKKNALNILAKIASAIQHLKNRNIVHRDLKPDNILIDKENMIPFVFDFGIAKVIDEIKLDNGIDTQTNAFIGTYFYSAPEQKNAKEASEKNDVYSLGCILYELLTGEILFKEKTICDIQKKKMNLCINKVRYQERKIIQRCLQPNCHSRISIDDLSKILNNMTKYSVFWKNKEILVFFTVALCSVSFHFNIYLNDYSLLIPGLKTNAHKENDGAQNHIITESKEVEENSKNNIADTYVVAQQILKNKEFILCENKKMTLNAIFSDYGKEIFQRTPHLFHVILPTGLEQENNLIFYNTNDYQEKYECILIIGEQSVEFTIYRR